MKFIHTADFHLIKSRIVDLENSLNQISSFAKKESCDSVFVCGDVFHKRLPDNESRELFYKFVKELYPVKVIVVSGTHDFSAGTHSLQPLNLIGLNNFIFYNDFNIHELEINNNIIKILTIPHLKNDTITEDVIKEKIRKLSDSDSVYKIVVGHFSIIGVSDGSYVISKNDDFSFNKDIFLDDKIDFVLLGHIHQPQIIENKILYSGAIEHIDWGEINQKRGFFYIKDKEVQFIPLLVRKKYDIVFSKDFNMSSLQKLEDNSLIRIIVENLDDFDIREINKYLKNKNIEIYKIVFKNKIENKYNIESSINKTWKDFIFSHIEKENGFDKFLLKKLFNDILVEL